MWNFSLNNLSLSDQDTTIPKAERKALEKRRLRKKPFGQKIEVDSVKREAQRGVQSSLNANALRIFTPKMRFITRDDGYGAWEVLTVYEVVSQEWDRLKIRVIYEDSGGLYGGWRDWTIEVDIAWIKENLLAMPKVWWLLGVPLIPYIQEGEWKKQVIARSRTDGLMVNQNKYNPRGHEWDIRTLDTLFFSGNPDGLIIENTDFKIVVRATPYEQQYSFEGNPVPENIYGDWFWLSLPYEYALNQIFQKFFGKRVKITYRTIAYDNQKNGQSLEYDQNPIIGVVWNIERYWRMLNNRISLENATQGSSKITQIPSEAFLTGFTVELIED